MEQLWKSFARFVRESLTEKFKTFLPGCIVGLGVAKSLLFSGLSADAITVAAYCIKYIATVFMCVGSGLGTAYGAYLVKKITNTDNEQVKSPAKKDDNERTA